MPPTNPPSQEEFLDRLYDMLRASDGKEQRDTDSTSQAGPENRIDLCDDPEIVDISQEMQEAYGHSHKNAIEDGWVDVAEDLPEDAKEKRRMKSALDAIVSELETMRSQDPQGFESMRESFKEAKPMFDKFIKIHYECSLCLEDRDHPASEQKPSGSRSDSGKSKEAYGGRSEVETYSEEYLIHHLAMHHGIVAHDTSQWPEIIVTVAAGARREHR